MDGWVGETHVQFLLILQKMQLQMLNIIFQRDVETKNGANLNGEFRLMILLHFFFLSFTSL